jgi:hypothetical protein
MKRIRLSIATNEGVFTEGQVDVFHGQWRHPSFFASAQSAHQVTCRREKIRFIPRAHTHCVLDFRPGCAPVAASGLAGWLRDEAQDDDSEQ